jgi:thioredoxin reductase (NADPH)
LNSQIKKIGGEQKVEYVLLDNDNKIETDGVFFEIGVKPLSDLAEKIGVELENKAIKVDKRKQTNVKGVFAAGDVKNTPLRQIITAASDGAIAADSAYRYVSENE